MQFHMKIDFQNQTCSGIKQRNACFLHLKLQYKAFCRIRAINYY